MNPESLDRITAFADALASVLESASKNECDKKKMIELQDEIGYDNSKIADLQDSLNISNAKVGELEDALHEMNLKVNELSNVGHGLNAQLLSCRCEKMQLELTIFEKDKRIKDLEEKLERAKVAIEALIPQ